MQEYVLQSQRVLKHLSGWGFPSDVQQRIGALAVLWGVFETSLESALWALKGENVKGVRPSTDKTSIGEWIDDWPQAAAFLSASSREVVSLASEAAKNLMDYRHAIMHGWMIPSPTMPSFIRNPSWNGEIRKRPSHDAHVDSNLLDLAIDCAWTLCQVVNETRDATKDAGATTRLEALRSSVVSARSSSGELRHLTELMNHEKN